MNDDEVRLLSSQLLRYVSRAGLKLEAALKRVQLDVIGSIVMDVGQSTGGFTDCLLQAGCQKVIGIDVGQGQLHAQLQSDSRVVWYEGLNIREPLPSEHPLLKYCQNGFDLVVIDVSFISLLQVLPAVKSLLSLKLKPSQTKILALVKPQFEVGAAHLNKRGVVKDSGQYSRVQVKIEAGARAEHFRVLSYFASELVGADGNQEFFIFLEGSHE